MKKSLFNKYSILPLLCISITTAFISCGSNDDDDDGNGYEDKTYDGLAYVAPEKDHEPFAFISAGDASVVAFYMNQETSRIKSGYYLRGDKEFLVRFDTDGSPIGAYSQGYYFTFSDYTNASVKVTAYDNLQQQINEVIYSDSSIGDIQADMPTLRSVSSITADMLVNLSISMDIVAKGGNQAVANAFPLATLPAVIAKHFGNSMDKNIIYSNLLDAMNKFGYDESITPQGMLAYEIDRMINRNDDAERALMSKMRELNFYNNLNDDTGDRIKLSTRAIVSLINKRVTIEGHIFTPSGGLESNTPVDVEVYFGSTPPPSTKNGEKTHVYSPSNNIFSFQFNTSNLTPNKKYFVQNFMYLNGKQVKGSIHSFIIAGEATGEGWHGTHKFTYHGKSTVSAPGIPSITKDIPNTTLTEAFNFEIRDGAIYIPNTDLLVIESSINGDDVLVRYSGDIEGVKVEFRLDAKMDSTKKKMKGTSRLSGSYNKTEGGITVSMEISGTGNWDATLE